ncbi:MAG TPA: hypothetical protein VEJ43_12545 [Pseudolabrys sp.]|nr:hypothetical protein [Pseudolabrys sp.]
MFSMIRPIEETMAIEQAAAQLDLRDPPTRRRDVRAFFWLCGWGGAAVFALIVFAIASQTKTASDRLRLIFAASEPSAVAQMPPRVAQLEIETQFLTEQMRALATDRDRLAGRIALLESSVDDMTGAIKKQAAATAALVAKTTSPTGGQSATAATMTPPAATNRPAPIATNPTSPNTPATTASVAPSQAPAPPAASAPLPLARAATAAQASEPESTSANPVEFGLDLGGATTVDGVRQRWIAVKANFGPLLSGMYPIAAHEHRPGSAGYRLVVGPLPNSAAASSLCAHFTAARTACRSAKFDGEQIVQR